MHKNKLFLIAVVSCLTACGGPLGFLPGGSLGESDLPFSALHIPPEGGVIELETKPDDPYSVKIGAVVVDGSLYIDPAPERRWYQHMVDNPDIRFRFDGEPPVYTGRVYPVEDTDIVSQFESGRIVLRLGPRL